MKRNSSAPEDGMAGVMTPEFISTLRQIYEHNPDLFGGKDVSEWTRVDVANAVVGAFAQLVGDRSNSEPM